MRQTAILMFKRMTSQTNGQITQWANQSLRLAAVPVAVGTAGYVHGCPFRRQHKSGVSQTCL